MCSIILCKMKKNIDEIRRFLVASRRAHAIQKPWLRMIIIVPHPPAHEALEAALVEKQSFKTGRGGSIFVMKLTARREATKPLCEQRDG